MHNLNETKFLRNSHKKTEPTPFFYLNTCKVFARLEKFYKFNSSQQKNGGCPVFVFITIYALILSSCFANLDFLLAAQFA